MLIRKVIALFMASVLLLSTASCSLTSKERFSVKYGENDNGVYLKKFTGTSTDVEFTVADNFEGKPVVELVDFAVSNSEYLQELNIGANVEIISSWAITNCPVLKSINVSRDNKAYTSKDGVLYSKDMKTILCFPNMNSTRYVIPEGVETVSMNAFYKCSNMTEVVLPGSIKLIEDRAFQKCVNLKSISLGDLVEKIGIDSFSFCTGLTEMFIPKSVKSIGDFAFYNCGNIALMSMEAKDASTVSLGKDWLPRKTDAVKTKIGLAWGCEREAVN